MLVQNSNDASSRFHGGPQRSKLSPTGLREHNRSAQRYSLMSETGKIMHRRLNTSVGQQRLKKSNQAQLC
jgi:hypothetical protein